MFDLKLLQVSSQSLQYLLRCCMFNASSASVCFINAALLSFTQEMSFFTTGEQVLTRWFQRYLVLQYIYVSTTSAGNALRHLQPALLLEIVDVIDGYARARRTALDACTQTSTERQLGSVLSEMRTDCMDRWVSLHFYSFSLLSSFKNT
jgi:hypothetical protein